MFKVGDRVRIRQWDDMEREFGLDPDGDIDSTPSFTMWMCDEGLCGRTATILSIDPNGWVDLDFDDEHGDIEWEYSTAMLDPLEDDEDLAVYWETDTQKKDHFIKIDSKTAILIDDILDALETLRNRIDVPHDIKADSQIAIDVIMRITPRLLIVDDCPSEVCVG